MIPERTTFKSGHVLQVQPASFQLACALRRAVAASLKTVRFDPSGIDLSAGLATQIPWEMLKEVLCELLSNKSVEDAVWACAEGVCTLNNLKLAPSLFDGPPGEDWRGDYLNCAVEVARVNLSPFLKGLDFKWLSPAKTEPASGQP